MSEEILRYAVRWYTRARRDVDSAVVDYAEYSGDIIRAAQMYDEMEELAGTLNENPNRYAIAETESVAFGFPVRRVLYRLTRGSRVAYHLIYYAVEESPDGATVTVLHVRHASRAPLTTEEASEIKGQQDE